MSRKPHKPTDEQRKQVQQAKVCGLTNQNIADLINIDEKTLVKHYKKELNSAKSKAIVAVASNLYRRATGDSKEAVPAAIFWLKTQAGWRERTEVDHLSSDGSMSPKGRNLDDFYTDSHVSTQSEPS